MAHAVGVRAESCTTDVPKRIRVVSRPHHANGVKASEPHASAVNTVSKFAASAAATSSAWLVGGCAPQYPSCSPSFTMTAFRSYHFLPLLLEPVLLDV